MRLGDGALCWAPRRRDYSGSRDCMVQGLASLGSWSSVRVMEVSQTISRRRRARPLKMRSPRAWVRKPCPAIMVWLDPFSVQTWTTMVLLAAARVSTRDQQWSYSATPCGWRGGNVSGANFRSWHRTNGRQSSDMDDQQQQTCSTAQAQHQYRSSGEHKGGSARDQRFLQSSATRL